MLMSLTVYLHKAMLPLLSQVTEGTLDGAHADVTSPRTEKTDHLGAAFCLILNRSRPDASAGFRVVPPLTWQSHYL